jgi:hypothetical protein
MANQNQHIEDYLDAYRLMPDTDFAVMITGPWGSGKTWFINEYLKHKCTKKGTKEFLYLSLNGVAATADIDMLIFRAAHPLLGSKLAVAACRVLMASVKAGFKIDLDLNRNGQSDGEANIDPLAGIPLADFKLKAKGKLIVFDDLERCLLSAEEILGYINSFVEHGETKVILIGEESQFTKKNEGTYNTIKEKVVGKSFRVAVSIEDVFDSLCSETAFPHSLALIRRNKEAVTNIFRKVYDATQKCNYRALKHCFRDFDYFCQSIDPSFQKNDRFMDALLAVFVTIDYEVQLANLTVEDIKRGPSDEEKDDGQKTESKYAIVLKRHGLQDSGFMPEFSTVVLPREFWIMIIQNEGIDRRALSEAIRNSKYFPANQPEWVVLWHWRNLDDGVAADALAKVRDKLKKQAYCTREEILHVFSILIGLAGLGAIPETKEKLVHDLRSYVDVLLTNKRLVIPPYGFRDLSLGGYHGLGYWTDNTADHSELVAVIRDALEKAVAKDKVESVAVWLSQVGEFPGQFYPKLEMNAEFSRQPVLHLFKPAQFLDELVKIPNKTKLSAQNILINRFMACDAQRAAELPFLTGIVHELDKRIANCVGPITPTMANLKYLRDQLTKILPSFREMAAAKGVDSPPIKATIET